MFSLTEHPRWVHLRKRNFEKLWKHPHISAHWIETPRFDGKFHALSISPSTSSTNPVPHSQYFRPMTHPVLPAGVLHSSAAETTNCLQNNAQNYDLSKTELVRNPFKKKYKSRKYCSQPFLQPGCRYGCVFVFVFVCVCACVTDTSHSYLGNSIVNVRLHTQFYCWWRLPSDTFRVGNWRQAAGMTSETAPFISTPLLEIPHGGYVHED